MATTPAPRLDLEAYHYATTAPFAFVVKELADLLGAKLVAYIAGVRETRAVREWAEGGRQARGVAVEDRLRLALRLARLLHQHDAPSVVQAWFQGLNPQLGDRSPARLLREGDIADVGADLIAAARAFVVGG